MPDNYIKYAADDTWSNRDDVWSAEKEPELSEYIQVMPGLENLVDLSAPLEAELPPIELPYLSSMQRVLYQHTMNYVQDGYMTPDILSLYMAAEGGGGMK